MKQRSQSSTPNILQEVQKGKVYPVYLLCGEESFLIEDTLKGMLDSLLEPALRDFNLNFLDGIEASVREILSAVEVYPMLSDWRVVVVRESTVFKAQKGTSQLELMRNAIDAADQSPRRAIALMTKALGVSAQDIADQSHDFNSSLKNFIEPNEDSLSSEDLDFLRNLPHIATQIDAPQAISAPVDDTELLIEWLQGALPKTSVLIFTFTGSVDGRSRLVKAIERAGRYVSFASLEVGQSLQQDDMFQRVSSALEEVGKKISPSAFHLLQKRTGNEMRLIFEELEKVVAFVGSKMRIDERDIQNLVVQSSFDNIFALTDAIGKRALPQALSSLHSVLESGEPPIKVNALITRQIRLMLQAKLLVGRGALKPTAGQMNYQNFVDTVFKPLAAKMSDLLPESAQINLLKQNPYAAYKVIQAFAYFGTEELIHGLEKTLDADIQLKSSQLDPACILEQLVYELCAKPTFRRPVRR